MLNDAWNHKTVRINENSLVVIPGQAQSGLPMRGWFYEPEERTQ
jgi:hypothetical protein